METMKANEFAFFGQLTEDLQVSILTFVAEAPFENSARDLASARTREAIAQTCRSSLTNILPLVSKQFRDYCQQDIFWKIAFVRLLQQDFELWKIGLFHLLSLPPGNVGVGTNQGSNRTVVKTIPGKEDTSPPDNAGAGTNQGSNGSSLATIPGNDDASKSLSALWSFLEDVYARWGQPGGYRALFQDVVRRYLRCTAPIFFMPGLVSLNEIFRLHLFEPRYRFMIAELLMAHPESCRNGSAIPEGHRPTFLYSFDDRPPPAAGKAACLVHVTRCFVYANGTADVECLPVDYVYLENVWVRQDRGHLFMGQCRRMSQAWQDNILSRDRVPQQLGRWIERILGQPVVVVRGDLPSERETHAPDDRRF